jgi:hypothetical protein
MRIETLTPAQIAKFPEYVERWTNIGLSTEPANRPEAERGINLMYKMAGLRPPKKIVWCGSPLGNGLSRAIVLNDKKIKVSVGANVADRIQRCLKRGIYNYVGDNVGIRAWDCVRQGIASRTRDSIWSSVGNHVGDGILNCINLVDSVKHGARNSVEDIIRTHAKPSIWARIAYIVDAVAWAAVWDYARTTVAYTIWESIHGQHEASWLAFYRFFRNECGLVKQTEELEGLWLLCQNAGWTLPHKNVCWVSERHNILRRDDRGRLHCENGPALAYPDGWCIYAWHGVRVPERIIMRPETIIPNEIAGEGNAEIRRVMLEKFGREKFLTLRSCVKAHTDDWGTLYRNNAIRDINDEPYCFVKVVNATPEPDGTFKDYILRVHPRCRTAREAVQSTFPQISNFNPGTET